MEIAHDAPYGDLSMTTPAFSISLVRELRGSPLTVLVAILLLEQSGQVPVTAQAIKATTGYSDHAVADSLRALEFPTRQLVVRVVGGWRLAGGFQLPLTFENRDIRGFEPTTTTTYISPVFNKKREREQVAEAEEVTNENRAIRGFATPKQEAIYKILGEALIGEPVRTRLATQLDDPIYVLAHCIKAAWENLETGLLIHRLRSGDHVDEQYRRKAQDKVESYYS
jgi:hypothetical protein